MRLEMTARRVQMTIKPKHPCVNPVFEFSRAPRGWITVSIDGRLVETTGYAWDGRTLWLDRTFDAPATLVIGFDTSDPRVP